MKKTLGAVKYNQIYLDEVKKGLEPKRLEPRKDKVGALENRVGALEDRSPQETMWELEQDIGLDRLRLVPQN